MCVLHAASATPNTYVLPDTSMGSLTQCSLLYLQGWLCLLLAVAHWLVQCRTVLELRGAPSRERDIGTSHQQRSSYAQAKWEAKHTSQPESLTGPPCGCTAHVPPAGQYIAHTHANRTKGPAGPARAVPPRFPLPPKPTGDASVLTE